MCLRIEKVDIQVKIPIVVLANQLLEMENKLSKFSKSKVIEPDRTLGPLKLRSATKAT